MDRSKVPIGPKNNLTKILTVFNKFLPNYIPKSKFKHPKLNYRLRIFGQRLHKQYVRWGFNAVPFVVLHLGIMYKFHYFLFKILFFFQSE